jgi:hypothetical protein
MLPLLAAVYRAPFGGTDFSVYLTGRTGTFKTALAALCQQHFGAGLDASGLPANFASTPNALEELAFMAKDTLLVVDDFAPTGGISDNNLQAVAERLFRSTGNHQGRLRMGGDRQLGGSRPPRALILATGEEVPSGHSLRARLLVLELQPGEVDRTALSACQHAAREGTFAAAMAAYLTWIAGRFEQLQENLHDRIAELRTQFLDESVPTHRRLPTMLAELQAGWEIWLQYAVEIGAITHAEEQKLKQKAVSALTEIASIQSQYHQASDPAFRFLALLRAALASGHAHIADRLGRAPMSPALCGWHKPQRRAWIPKGMRIGWVAKDDLYLEPTVSYQMAQQWAGSEGLPISAQTLRRRLRERGLLASTDAGRQMLIVRRTLEGGPKEVLHLKVRDLLGRSTDHPTD